MTVTLVVGFLFVRGPNGLIRMLAHWRRVKTADSELNVVQQQVDSLRELQRQFGDTAFLHRFAAGIMDGIGKPVPRPDSADAGGAAAGQDLSTSNNGPGLTGN